MSCLPLYGIQNIGAVIGSDIYCRSVLVNISDNAFLYETQTVGRSGSGDRSVGLGRSGSIGRSVNV